MVNVLAIPVLKGRKTDNERFAGATTTWTCEAMMRDGKALQMGTSHELGQNFARAFDITFLDESGQQEHVWQTSWGVSTRLMGALVMVHGDDDGLRLPPRLAPVQVVVILVKAEDGADTAAAALAEPSCEAPGIRVELDARTDTSFGRRAVDWELKGVPLRLEVGPRDLAQGVVVMARRDTGTKAPVALAGVVAAVDRGARSHPARSLRGGAGPPAKPDRGCRQPRRGDEAAPPPGSPSCPCRRWETTGRPP